MKLHYLAYGSNLHPLRLQRRIPSARLAGTAELPGRTLSFSKRSVDGSAKCTLIPGEEIQRAFGAVYEIDWSEKPELDRIEGLGAGYDERWEVVSVVGINLRAFTYVAAAGWVDVDLKPYHWYRALVVAGARHLGFPVEYIAALERIDSIEDPDEQRGKTHQALLAEIAAAQD